MRINYNGLFMKLSKFHTNHRKSVPTCLLLLLLMTCGAVYEVNAQAWQWAATVGGPVTDNNNVSPDETIKGMVTDSQGNVYACGTVLTPAQINGVPITTYGGYNIFIAKYSCQGNLLWYKTAGSGGESKAYDLLLDNSGNIYVTGQVAAQTGQPCYFFDSTITETTYDMFLAKFDTAGNFKWGRWAAPGSAQQGTTGKYMAWDSYGMINILLRNSGIGDLFPGYPLNIQGYQIARFDTAGNINKLTPVISTISAGPSDFKIDIAQNNAIYLIGGIYGATATIGGQVYNRIAASGASDMYVVKLDSLGQHIWGIQHGMPGFASIVGYGIDKSGQDWVITGQTRDSAILGSFMFLNPITLTSYFPFTARINSNGVILSASNSLTQYDSSPTGGITNISYGKSYFGGWFAGQAIFGIDTFPNSNGLRDAFLCEVDSSGTIVGATKLDCTGSNEEPQCISRDNDDNIFIGGGLDGTLTINGNSITSSGGNTDAFIAKFGTVCTVGISEYTVVTNGFLHIYPNPATDFIHIQTGHINNEIIIAVYNPLGQKMIQNKIAKNSAMEITIDINKLQSGIYIVKVSSDNEMQSSRFVKH